VCLSLPSLLPHLTFILQTALILSFPIFCSELQLQQEAPTADIALTCSRLWLPHTSRTHKHCTPVDHRPRLALSSSDARPSLLMLPFSHFTCWYFLLNPAFHTRPSELSCLEESSSRSMISVLMFCHEQLDSSFDV
jgi:hypothetical protein